MTPSLFTSSFRRWFWTCVVVTSFGFGSFLVASEILVRTYVEPVDIFEQSITVFHTARRNGVENATFGDSIPARGLLFDDSFVNLAFPGERPFGTSIKIHAYFQGLSPGQIILPANTNLLLRPVEDSRGYASIFLEQRRSTVRLAEERHRQYLFYYWKTLLTKGGFHSTVVVGPNGGLIPTNEEDARRYSRLSEEERMREAEEVVLRDLPPDNPAWFAANENLRILSEAIHWLQDKGAEVCLVSFPLSPEYRRLAAKYAAFDLAHLAFEKLAKQANARHVDFRTSYDDPVLFDNPNHIGYLAAADFANEVTHACFLD